jgi:hypothetical protein
LRYGQGWIFSRAGAQRREAGGKITGPVNLSTTYTNCYVIKANKLEGFTK